MPILIAQLQITDDSDKTITGTWEFDRDGYGTLITPHGTAFPDNPTTNEFFLRTDLDQLYYYDGYGWESLGGTVILDGYVQGPTPASSTDEAIVRWDGTTGRLLQNSNVTIDNSGNISTSGNITVSGTVDGVDVSNHNARHIRGGADEIDGDKIDIDFTPINYTPTTSPAEVTNVDELTAHLAGIDGYLGNTGITVEEDDGTVVVNADTINFEDNLDVTNDGGKATIKLSDSITVSGTINGYRHYAASATDPTSPSPSEGDRYYNTTLEMEMRYDGSRSKWLSVESSVFQVGRSFSTGAGDYYRGINGLPLSASIGFPAFFNGTVVSFGYTRSDSDSATFEITASGSSVASLASSATSGYSSSLNGNFSAGDILAVRNSAGSNTTTSVQAWVRVKWRA